MSQRTKTFRGIKHNVVPRCNCYFCIGDKKHELTQNRAKRNRFTLKELKEHYDGRTKS
jgi:hypothetical protein